MGQEMNEEADVEEESDEENEIFDNHNNRDKSQEFERNKINIEIELLVNLTPNPGQTQLSLIHG